MVFPPVFLARMSQPTKLGRNPIGMGQFRNTHFFHLVAIIAANLKKEELAPSKFDAFYSLSLTLTRDK